MIELAFDNETFRKLSPAEQVDAVCDAFEQDWRSGVVRSFEEYIALVDPSCVPMLRGELALLHRDFENLGLSLGIVGTVGDKDAREDTNSDRLSPFKVELPSRFENFLLLEEVGRGAAGVVIRAEDLDLGCQVAVKLPHQHFVSAEHDQTNFLREARNAARLNHEGIVRIIRVGEWRETPFIVSEFVRGMDLKRWLQHSGRRLTFREVARLIVDLAIAVEHAHSQKIIHRDLKPSNIMIEERKPDLADVSGGQNQALLKPRLLDFGICKLLGSTTCDTRHGDMLGTPAYMSPEQASGEAVNADQRSDIYSLGVILYELLCGSAPFAGNSVQILDQVRGGTFVPVLQRSPEVPKPLADVCHHCMQLNPSDRYATAAALAVDLQKWLRNEPVSAPSSSAKRRRLASTALALATLVSVLAAGLFSFSAWARFQEQGPRKGQIDGLRVKQSLPLSVLPEGEFPVEDEASESEAQSQAQISLQLFELRDFDSVWPVLRAYPDPRMRTYFTGALASTNLSMAPLIERLKVEKEPSIQYGILISLGLRDPSKISASESLLAWCKNAYLTNNDSGVHSACLWLLHRLGQKDFLASAEEQLKKEGIVKGRFWHVSPSGLLFVHCQLPDDFKLRAGSSVETAKNQEPRNRRMAKRFAIAAMELPADLYAAFAEQRQQKTESKRHGNAATKVSALDILEFCHWLDQQESVPESHRSVACLDEREFLVDLEKFGYRIPTEIEWEYTCRSGTLTSTYFGSQSTHHECEKLNLGKTDREGFSIPNAFGCFSMLGGVREWVFDLYVQDLYSSNGVSAMHIAKNQRGLLRGASFLSGSEVNPGLQRTRIVISRDIADFGFRICKSLEEE